MKKTVLILMTIIYALSVACKKDVQYEIGQSVMVTNGVITPVVNTDEIIEYTVPKNVLLEDYTGVRCVNCPASHQIALELQEKYEYKVIPLFVHAGALSAVPPNGSYIDFTTDEADEWYYYFGFDLNPVGTINRKIVDGIYAFSTHSWEEEVANAIQEETTVEMTTFITYNDANRELKVDVNSKFLVEMPDTYSLTVCIVEDSIKGGQMTPQGNNLDYIHRYVFRTTMNGTWGEELNTAAVAPQELITKSYITTLNEAYNADQCYIIAYVSNSATKEILQVIEKKIK